MPPACSALSADNMPGVSGLALPRSHTSAEIAPQERVDLSLMLTGVT